MDLNQALEKMPKTLDEINLQLYLDFARETRKLSDIDQNSIDAQMIIFRLVELFLGVNEGEIDDMPLADIQVLCEKVTALISEQKQFVAADHFTIGETTYATRKIKDMNSLTTGEYTSIKTLQESMKDELDFLPYALAILIRPAHLVKDEETGTERWVQDKFNQRDIDNLEWRVNLFKEKALAKDLIPVCNFFLNGNE